MKQFFTLTDALLLCVLGFVLGVFVGIGTIYGPAHAKGFCEAIHTVSVADTLCVRGDSIVARVPR